jgi:O-methyltransferase
MTFNDWLHQRYIDWLRPHIASELNQQRLKMLWFGWGYAPMLRLPGLSVGQRLRLIRQFLRIDWQVLHAHKPHQIVAVAQGLAETSPAGGAIMVEAGCWFGGSTCKFSLLCDVYQCALHVYDSFAGVEAVDEGGNFFGGTYAAPRTVVEANLARFGVQQDVTLHPGWFVDTLARQAVPAPVRVAYIDCDLAKGTLESLLGIIPKLTADGAVFSQDYHISRVKKLLHTSQVWEMLKTGEPVIEHIDYQFVRLRFPHAVRGGTG